jgi:hypothetical protein
VQPADLQVSVGGVELAAFASAARAPMRESDFLLFYVPGRPDSVQEVEIGVGAGASRMEEVYVGPGETEGDVTYAVATTAETAEFETGDAIRHILTGFADQQVWLLDITDSLRPKLLFGAEILSVNGEQGLYFSYAPEQPARCLAVGASAVLGADAASR